MTVATQLTERELVGAATTGDRHALDELVRLHEHRIAGLCRSRLRSREDAADAVQETFARALSRLHQLKDPDAFGPWLRTIAVRVCADVGRELSRVSMSALVGDTVDEGPPPDALAEAADDRGRLHRALADLGERDRHALWLRHGMEAPVSRVADELGLTEGSTRVLLTRARRRLREAASGLAAMFPVAWRDWGRAHLATLLQRPDLAGALTPLAAVAFVFVFPVAPPSTQELIEPSPIQTASRTPTPATVTPELTPQVALPAPTRSTVTSAADTDDGVSRAPGGQPPADLLDDVRVQDDYPEDEPYLIEVRVISDGDAATLRLYGDPTDDPTAAADDTVAGLLGD